MLAIINKLKTNIPILIPVKLIERSVCLSVHLWDRITSSSERKELLTCFFFKSFFDDAILQRFGQIFRTMCTFDLKGRHTPLIS